MRPCGHANPCRASDHEGFRKKSVEPGPDDEALRTLAGMRKRAAPTRPTEAECSILSVVWEKGRVTVRQVYEALAPTSGVGLTTVLKLMQIMVEKGILERDSSVRPQVFRAAQPRRRTQRELLRDLAERVFSGSPGTLALEALSLKKASPDELEEIRNLLDRLEKDAR